MGIRNVLMKVEGDKLTITVDLKQKGVDSASGKSVVIATTAGNVDIPGGKGAKIGLNIYRKKD